jgi:glycosyltransferase involved in cell wall biosynthesis
LIRKLGLGQQVTLVGHVAHEHIGHYYDQAHMVVLTSRSEGIPLVLMEAMAREKIVVAPAITGIPELVLDGRTGFLYKSGALEEFVRRVDQIHRSLRALDPVRRAAREHVRRHFHRETNLRRFGEVFLEHTTPAGSSLSYANPVLQ